MHKAGCRTELSKIYTEAFEPQWPMEAQELKRV